MMFKRDKSLFEQLVGRDAGRRRNILSVPGTPTHTTLYSLAQADSSSKLSLSSHTHHILLNSTRLLIIQNSLHPPRCTHTHLLTSTRLLIIPNSLYQVHPHTPHSTHQHTPTHHSKLSPPSQVHPHIPCSTHKHTPTDHSELSLPSQVHPHTILYSLAHAYSSFRTLSTLPAPPHTTLYSQAHAYSSFL